MREGLKAHLRDLGSEIKKDDQPAIADRIDARRDVTDTSWEQQENVYEIQIKKQQIMAELKAALEAVGTDQEPSEPLGKRAVYDQARGTFSVDGYDGPVTRGDIMTDMVWGNYYQLDNSTVPRIMRKQYLVELAKNRLSRLLDTQVGFDAGMFHRVGANSVQNRQKQRIHDREQLKRNEYGFVAEQLVVNVLRKKHIDDHFPLRVLESDVELEPQKVDFIVQVPKYMRGVDVDLDEETEAQTTTVAVQLKTQEHSKTPVRKYQSSTLDEAKTGLREKGIIDDLVGLQINAVHVRRAYKNWLHSKCPPGGPEKFLSEDLKGTVVSVILHDILPKQVREEENRKEKEQKTEAVALQKDIEQAILVALDIDALVPSEQRIVRNFVKDEKRRRLKEYAPIEDIAKKLVDDIIKTAPGHVVEVLRQYEVQLEAADERRVLSQDSRLAELIDVIKSQRDDVDFAIRAIERGDTFGHPHLYPFVVRFQKRPNWKILQEKELEILYYFLRPELMHLDLLQHNMDEADHAAFEEMSVAEVKDMIQEQYRKDLTKRLKEVTLRMEIYRDIQHSSTTS